MKRSGTRASWINIGRVKILVQTQDSNPKILLGEEERYSSLVDCFKRVNSEQGLKAFWRGNLVNLHATARFSIGIQ